MNTSDAPKGAATGLLGDEVPAELRGTILDPAVLQHIAGELFRAAPGAPSALVSPREAPSPGGDLPGPASALAEVGRGPLGASSSGTQPPVLPSAELPSWVPDVGAGPLGSLARAPRQASDVPYFLETTGARAGGAPAHEGAGLDPSVVPDLGASGGFFDVATVRRSFPLLGERVRGRPLVWLDSAATTQKPRAVIDRVTEVYERECSNVHRGAHTLAARATDAFESAREKVRRFIGAGSTHEIVFVRGATEAINLVAQSWGRRHVGAGDEIVLTWLEHHSNIVPWQILAAERGAKLRVAPVGDDGQILLNEYEKLLGPRTRIVALTQVSNALGTVTPAKAMIEMAHRHGARVLVDGAQAISHMPVDVQSLGCDFYAFSGHKVFAPMGIGVLFGRSEALAETPPWQGGGNMIVDVTFEKTTYAAVPARLEAGTGSIADAIGLGAAIDFLEGLGMANVARYEHELLAYATDALATVPGLRPIGTAREKAAILSFVLDAFRSEEVGSALDRDGIAVRSGHHCAQPALRRFGLESTVRPSLALYNTRDDIDALVASLLRLRGTRPRAR